MIDGQFSRQEVTPNTSATCTPSRQAIQVTSNLLSAEVRSLIGLELSDVESTLATELCSHYPQVNELASKAASLGGKRLRPVLTLLAASVVGKCNADSVRVATTVELVHAASLVHDDVLDNAACRRHQATIHAQVGIPRSIILGDFLFTRAYAVAAKCRSTLPARSIATAATQLCEGELRQQSSASNWQITEAEYFDILRQKTGELCAVSCRLGAWSTGCSSTHALALSKFGRRLGVAFQIVDDWLDVWGTDQVGKTLGTDLAQRKPTLPIIRLLGTRPERLKLSLIKLLESADRQEEVHELLRHSDAADYTLFRARRLIDRALVDLSLLPSSAARNCLEQIAAQCVARAA